MGQKSTIRRIIPVLPSQHITRDIVWYETQAAFQAVFHDDKYAVLRRDNIYLHLQWHADTDIDPLLGGSVIRIEVAEIEFILEEFVRRGTVKMDALRRNTPWNTHEFGFYDLNKNAIFMMQEV